MNLQTILASITQMKTSLEKLASDPQRHDEPYTTKMYLSFRDRESDLSPSQKKEIHQFFALLLSALKGLSSKHEIEVEPIGWETDLTYQKKPFKNDAFGRSSLIGGVPHAMVRFAVSISIPRKTLPLYWDLAITEDGEQVMLKEHKAPISLRKAVELISVRVERNIESLKNWDEIQSRQDASLKDKETLQEPFAKQLEVWAKELLKAFRQDPSKAGRGILKPNGFMNYLRFRSNLEIDLPKGGVWEPVVDMYYHYLDPKVELHLMDSVHSINTSLFEATFKPDNASAAIAQFVNKALASKGLRMASTRIPHLKVKMAAPKLITPIRQIMRTASSALPEGFEDFGFGDDIPEPKGPKVQSFGGIQRNAIISVGGKKWHVFKSADSYSLYAYAYKTSGRKMYEVYIDSLDGSTASVRQINGMSDRIGPVVASGKWSLVTKDGGEPLSR